MSFEYEIENAGVDMSDIPAYASVSEAVLYVMEANEKNFNEMKRSVGLMELGVYETTGHTVDFYNEAETDNKEDQKAEEDTKDSTKSEDKKSSVIDAVKDKAKDATEVAKSAGSKAKDAIIRFAIDAWSKIKGLFEKAIATLNAMSAKFVNAIGKKNLDATKMADAVKNIKKFNFTTYDYDNLGKFFDKNSDLRKNLKDFANDMNNEDAAKAVNKIITGNDTTETSPSKDDIVKYLRGEKHDFSESNMPAIQDIVKIVSSVDNVDDRMKTIKDSYKDCKAGFDTTIKNLKTAKEYDATVSKGVHNMVSYYTMIYGTVLAEYCSVIRSNISFATRLALFGSKKKEEAAPAKEAKPEAQNSATKTESAFTEEVNSLFDWNL